MLGVRVFGSKASVLHWNEAETSSSHPAVSVLEPAKTVAGSSAGSLSRTRRCPAICCRMREHGANPALCQNLAQQETGHQQQDACATHEAAFLVQTATFDSKFNARSMPGSASSSCPLSAKERRSQVPIRRLLPKRDRVAAEREEAAAVKQQQDDEERKRWRRKISLRALLKSADGLYPRRYVCIYVC